MADRILYAIKDWEKLYETAETRKLRHLRWVPVPNKQDGRGYCYLMAESDGVALLGAWLIILQVASKMPCRGVLADERGPLSARDIAVKARTSVEVIARALDLLTSSEIDWMTATPWKPSPAKALPPPAPPADSSRFPGEPPGNDYEIEGKGIEQNSAAQRRAASSTHGGPDAPEPRLPRGNPDTPGPMPSPKAARNHPDVAQELTAVAHAAIRALPKWVDCDREIARQVAAAAVEAYPAITPKELAYVVPFAQRGYQHKPALFVRTVPHEIRKRLSDEGIPLPNAPNPAPMPECPECLDRGYLGEPCGLPAELRSALEKGKARLCMCAGSARVREWISL